MGSEPAEVGPGHVVAVSDPAVAVARRVVSLVFTAGLTWRDVADQALQVVADAPDPTDAQLAAAELLDAVADLHARLLAIQRRAAGG